MYRKEILTMELTIELIEVNLIFNEIDEDGNVLDIIEEKVLLSDVDDHIINKELKKIIDKDERNLVLTDVVISY